MLALDALTVPVCEQGTKHGDGVHSYAIADFVESIHNHLSLHGGSDAQPCQGGQVAEQGDGWQTSGQLRPDFLLVKPLRGDHLPGQSIVGNQGRQHLHIGGLGLFIAVNHP